MKTKFTKIFITIFAVAIIATGISYVSAQTTQTNGPSNPDTYTKDLPVFTGENLQQKKGGFLSQKHIGAPVGFFNKSIYLPGSDSKLRIGSANGALSINPALFGDTSMEPVVIDMQNRAARTDATKFINGGQCAVATRLVTTNAAAYEFKTGNNLGNVIARQVQLTGGGPAANRVLVSDSNGNARWATATVSNGQVVFSTNTTSPVPEGQCIAPDPAPVDVCTNIDGIQTTVPAGMALDTNGNCVTPPVVDLCTNIAGNQATVPTGMIKDTPGTTPGNCSVPPTCSNIASISLPSGYPATPASGIPVGYKKMPDGTCQPYQHWGCLESTGYKWTKNSLVITNTSNPNFHQPYCTSSTYQPGDQYYRSGSFVCTDPGITPAASACSSTGTPVLLSCGNYSNLCRP